MNTCAICEKDILVEDTYKCDKCKRKVCPDHITNQGNRTDDHSMVCTDCLETAHVSR